MLNTTMMPSGFELVVYIRLKKHVATTECEWLFLFAILAHDQYSYFALCAIILTSSATITTDARTHMTSAH